jgi:hypothetical protein
VFSRSLLFSRFVSLKTLLLCLSFEKQNYDVDAPFVFRAEAEIFKIQNPKSNSFAHHKK